MEKILFYRVDKPYGFFSNFSPHPIRVDGKVWPTSEHYFQAMKFQGTTHEEEVRCAKTPAEAARIGRDRSRPLRGDWERVKDGVMRTALEAKFGQHPELMRDLIATGDAEIIEHTANDRYWADGGDGGGMNRLGKFDHRSYHSAGYTDLRPFRGQDARTYKPTDKLRSSSLRQGMAESRSQEGEPRSPSLASGFRHSFRE